MSEALILADIVEKLCVPNTRQPAKAGIDAAAELRRLSAVEQELAESREQQSTLRKALMETDAFKSAEITGAAMKGQQ